MNISVINSTISMVSKMKDKIEEIQAMRTKSCRSLCFISLFWGRSTDYLPDKISNNQKHFMKCNIFFRFGSFTSLGIFFFHFSSHFSLPCPSFPPYMASNKHRNVQTSVELNSLLVGNKMLKLLKNYR